MPVEHESCIDKLLDYIPDLMQKINEMFNKSIQQNEKKSDYQETAKRLEKDGDIFE